jgi:hypothetical protein
MTLTEISEAWKEYKSKRVLSILRNGKEVIEPLDGKKMGHIEGTSAQVILMSKAYTFPEFLEKVWTR